MKICVLQPDYAGSPVDYANYDPPRDLAPWLPGHQLDNLFLRKATSFAQLMRASEENYDIYINLCEGYPDWDIPGFDVIWALERLNLPFTGTSMRNFLHSKEKMKIVALESGVATAPWWIVRSLADLDPIPAALRYPLFVKPADAGDSLGIDDDSLVHNPSELRSCCAALLPKFNKLLVEEYVPGREFTVLLAADPDARSGVRAYTPFEFVFDQTGQFKTYRMKVTEHHASNNVPVHDPALAGRLEDMAIRIFRAFDAESYARIDIRANLADELFFLEINCECSVFYPEGSEGSADYILRNDPLGHAGFLRLIIADGIARHRARQPLFHVRLAHDGGYGAFAARDLAAGEIVADATHVRPFRSSADGNLVPRDAQLVTERAVTKGEELLLHNTCF